MGIVQLLPPAAHRGQLHPLAPQHRSYAFERDEQSSMQPRPIQDISDDFLDDLLPDTSPLNCLSVAPAVRPVLHQRIEAALLQVVAMTCSASLNQENLTSFEKVCTTHTRVRTTRAASRPWPN